MSSTITLTLCLILTLFTSGPVRAQTPIKPFRPRALVFPITKDPTTNQYTTIISQRTPLQPIKLTLDLGGKALWVACDRGEYNSSTYRPALCGSAPCKLARSKSCGNCWDGPRPGCNDHVCSTLVYNTVEKSAQAGELATDVIAIRSSNGSNPGPVVREPEFLFSCGSRFHGEKLAKGVIGMAGLGRTETSLPSLLSRSFRIPKKFAICLSSSRGVAFVGSGPYVLLPGLDVSARLVYTPLITNPVSTVQPVIDGFPDKSRPSFEYFIGVEAVKVNGRAVPLSPKLLKIGPNGEGGTKFSNVESYTVLRTPIYKAITSAFVTAISGVPRVGSVGPFRTCYRASSLGSTRVGPGVPPIELVLENNATWTIFGANSMVLMGPSRDVACLGFVDGGEKARASIVIGGYQMEDNLLEFDLEKSRVGFSSTLLGRQTTCANFNFKAKAT